MGELPRWKALRILARSQLFVLSSKVEGGANAVSEAIATSTPIVSSRIAGAVGILGEHYPAYFPVGDTKALAHLLTRVEVDGAIRQSLTAWCRALAPLVDPARERQSWAALIDELFDAPLHRR
jgi:glycosyltransferase involved in cell wall biosynthesis